MRRPSLLLLVLGLVAFLPSMRAGADETELERVFKALPDSPSPEDTATLYAVMLKHAVFNAETVRKTDFVTLFRGFGLLEFETEYYRRNVLGQATEEEKKYGKTSAIVPEKTALLKCLFARLALEAKRADGMDDNKDMRKALAMTILHEAQRQYRYMGELGEATERFAKTWPESASLDKWRDGCIEAKLATIALPANVGRSAIKDWKVLVDAAGEDADAYASLCLWFWRNIPASDLLLDGTRLPISVEAGDSQFRLLSRILAPEVLPAPEHWLKHKDGTPYNLSLKSPRSVKLAASLALLKLYSEKSFTERFRSRLVCQLLVFGGTYDLVIKAGVRLQEFWQHSDIQLPLDKANELRLAILKENAITASVTLKLEITGTNGPPACLAGTFRFVGEAGKTETAEDFVHPLVFVLIPPQQAGMLAEVVEDFSELAPLLAKTGIFKWRSGLYTPFECDFTAKTVFPKSIDVKWDYAMPAIKAMMGDGRMARYFNGIVDGPVLRGMTPELIPEYMRQRVFYRYPRTDWAIYSAAAAFPRTGKPFYSYPVTFLVLLPPKGIGPTEAIAGLAYKELCDWLTLSGLYRSGNRIWAAEESVSEPAYLALSKRALEIASKNSEDTDRRWEEGKKKAQADAYEEWGE